MAAITADLPREKVTAQNWLSSGLPNEAHKVHE